MLERRDRETILHKIGKFNYAVWEDCAQAMENLDDRATSRNMVPLDNNSGAVDAWKPSNRMLWGEVDRAGWG